MAVFRERPYGNFNFRVHIGEVDADDAAAAFCEVSGLSIEAGLTDYRGGNERSLSVRKASGTVECGNVTLKRGVSGSLTFWEWFAATRTGQPERRTVLVELMTENREQVAMTWRLINAFPIRYEGPQLNAKSSEIAIESITLAVEDIEIG